MAISGAFSLVDPPGRGGEGLSWTQVLRRKIKYFWAQPNFSLMFFDSLYLAYFFDILLFFIIQIPKFSSIAWLDISFLK